MSRNISQNAWHNRRLHQKTLLGYFAGNWTLQSSFPFYKQLVAFGILGNSTTRRPRGDSIKRHEFRWLSSLDLLFIYYLGFLIDFR